MPINYSLQTLLFHPAHLTRMALKPSPWKDSIFTQFQIKQNLLKIDRTRATKTHLQKTTKKTPHKKNTNFNHHMCTYGFMLKISLKPDTFVSLFLCFSATNFSLVQVICTFSGMAAATLALTAGAEREAVFLSWIN